MIQINLRMLGQQRIKHKMTQHISKAQMLSMYEHCMKCMQESDQCFFATQGLVMQGNGLCVANKGELIPQMKRWRKQAKQGIIVMHDYNCKTATTPDGKVWHFLVVQPKDLDDCWTDPVGLFLLGEWVDGWIYAFKSKKNRDAIQRYVMKVDHCAPH